MVFPYRGVRSSRGYEYLDTCNLVLSTDDRADNTENTSDTRDTLHVTLGSYEGSCGWWMVDSG